MSYENQKDHNTYVARDSINSITDKTLHDIQSQDSNSVQCVVLGGTIDVVDSGNGAGRIHLSEGTASTPKKIYTVGAGNIGPRQLPDVAEVAKTPYGTNLGLSMTGDSGPTAVVTVYIAEEF